MTTFISNEAKKSYNGQIDKQIYRAGVQLLKQRIKRKFYNDIQKKSYFVKSNISSYRCELNKTLF